MLHVAVPHAQGYTLLAEDPSRTLQAACVGAGVGASDVGEDVGNCVGDDVRDDVGGPVGDPVGAIVRVDVGECVAPGGNGVGASVRTSEVGDDVGN